MRSSGRSADRRVAAHAAGVWSFVAVEQSLVVAGRLERQGGCAVADGEDADLRSCEIILDHHLGVVTEFVRIETIDRPLGSGRVVVRDQDPFSCGEAIGLHHIGARRIGDVSERFRDVVVDAIPSG